MMDIGVYSQRDVARMDQERAPGVKGVPREVLAECSDANMSVDDVCFLLKRGLNDDDMDFAASMVRRGVPVVQVGQLHSAGVDLGESLLGTINSLTPTRLIELHQHRIDITAYIAELDETAKREAREAFEASNIADGSVLAEEMESPDYERSRTLEGHSVKVSRSMGAPGRSRM